MTFYSKYFDTAVALIEAYSGQLPLSAYLKQYFAQHKKHGSKDRRHITHFCYCYYRPGHALPAMPVAERLRIALYLCHNEPGEWLSLLHPGWQAAFDPNPAARIRFIEAHYPFNLAGIVYKKEALSQALDSTAFALSHLQQPAVFLRIRPGYEQVVPGKLAAAQLSYRQVSSHCLAVDNAVNVDAIIRLNTEAVIQDYASQQVGAFIAAAGDRGPVHSVWDCCAASGGKSILAADILPRFQLTVSDVRPSILRKLQQRFKEAGITRYRSFVADLTASGPPDAASYQLVICDAPCSGSGTWARTPEQLYFFTQHKLDHYVRLQQQIVRTAAAYVAPGGSFLYVTCSVYKVENEDMVEWIKQHTNLQLVQTSLITGYAQQADTMFAALFANR